MQPGRFPGDRQFAFTIIDDTDVATVDNVAPVYELLDQLGMRITKTVWPFSCPEGSKNFGASQTLEDDDYLSFVVDLQRRGHEIASHGATMESSTRGRTLEGFERVRATFGAYPRIHANHAFNRENLYWGADRVDIGLLKALYRRASGTSADYFQGHVEGSPYWWGDFCQEHITYVRNLTFGEINLDRIDPAMPYHDPTRPLVQRWFSASDAGDAAAFNRIVRLQNQQRLELQEGFCILATHLGKGFSRKGVVQDETRTLLTALAARNGWFPTVGELLDWLWTRRGGRRLSAREWRRMQWRWARDLAIRGISARYRRGRRRRRT